MNHSAAYWAMIFVYLEIIRMAIEAVLWYYYRCILCPIHGIEYVP